MNIAQLLARSARVFPDTPAIYHGTDLDCDYREFARRAAALAANLQEAGLAPGDRVALLMSNCPQYLVALYGIWYAGLVAVPINAKLHPREVAYIIANAEARRCFVTPEVGAALADLDDLTLEASALLDVTSPDYHNLITGAAGEPVAAHPDDLAWLFYTSGTTGRPKGVMLSHRNLLTMTLCYLSDVDTIAPGDCTLYAAPISHGAGMYNFAHVLRAARHIVPTSGGFDPAEILSLSRTHPGMALFAAPTMVRRLVEYVQMAQPELTGLKTIVYGGGPMYLADIREALAVLGDRLVQIYGQGESPMTITVLSRQQLHDHRHPRYTERIASVGVAQAVVEVRVTGPDGQSLPTEAIGEVEVRGDTVMLGYWRNPEATAATLVDGWLRTGDVGSLDGDGFLTLRDRSKDVIISGGSNIYPREVEEVLLRHPAVREVAVIGKPDPEWGEVVVAFVTCHAGMSVAPAELDTLCLEQIARFKRPREYRFVDDLPKNNYGKILKTVLRAW